MQSANETQKNNYMPKEIKPKEIEILIFNDESITDDIFHSLDRKFVRYYGNLENDDYQNGIMFIGVCSEEFSQPELNLAVKEYITDESTRDYLFSSFTDDEIAKFLYV